MSRYPGGKRLFSQVLARMVPYTGTVGATVLRLEPGRCQVELTDRRGIRNHLGSIHAVALMNVGEMASGLSLVAGLPESARAILVKFQIEFKKKARGRLLSECSCEIPPSDKPIDVELVSKITDEAGHVVAEVHALWKVGPKK